MISQKTTNVSTASEVVNSFMMIAQDKEFVTEEQLRNVLTPTQVDYCLKHMAKVPGGYDYKQFVDSVIFLFS